MATATDNFNRSETPLASPWTNQNGTWLANGTQGVPGNLGSDSMSVYNGSPLGSVGADQYAQAVIGSLTGGGAASGEGIGLTVRWGAAVGTGYRVVINAAATNNVRVHRWILDASTDRGTVTQAFAAGDVLRLEVSGQNTATVVLVKRAAAASPTSFSTILTINENDGSAINSGFPGLAYSSTLTAATLDNWEGGDLVSVTWDQEGYRWRNDNGDEVTASYIGAQDTPL